MHNTDGRSFYPVEARTLIEDTVVSCIVTNDPNGIYGAEPINELIKATNGLLRVIIKDKKDVIIKQVDGHTTS